MAAHHVLALLHYQRIHAQQSLAVVLRQATLSRHQVEEDNHTAGQEEVVLRAGKERLQGGAEDNAREVQWPNILLQLYDLLAKSEDEEVEAAFQKG